MGAVNIISYLVFAWNEYYPVDGPNQIRGSFSSLLDAKKLIKELIKSNEYEDFCIYDVHNCSIVEYEEGGD